MGAKLKTLSGRELIAIFEQFGFAAISQNGSHVKMRRVSVSGSETIIIPFHGKIPKGTLRAIFGQGARFIAKDDLYPHFHTSSR